jgi:hypothetical protein
LKTSQYSIFRNITSITCNEPQFLPHNADGFIFKRARDQRENMDDLFLQGLDSKYSVKKDLILQTDGGEKKYDSASSSIF